MAQAVVLLLVAQLSSLLHPALGSTESFVGSPFMWERLPDTECCTQFKYFTGGQEDSGAAKAFACDQVHRNIWETWAAEGQVEEPRMCRGFLQESDGSYGLCSGPNVGTAKIGRTCFRRLDTCKPYWTDSTSGKCKRFDFDAFCRDRAENGAPCVPGVDFLGRGFHILHDRLEPESLRASLPRGLLFTVEHAGTKRLFGQDFSYPAEVTVAVENSLLSTSGSQVYTSLEEYQSDLVVNSNAKVGLELAGGAEKTVQVSNSVKTTLKNHRKYTERQSSVLKYSMEITRHLEGSLDFWDALAPNSPLNVVSEGTQGMEEHAAAAADFLVSNFGTHIISAVHMGGSITLQSEYEACRTAEEIQQSSNVEFCVNVESAGKSGDGCVGTESGSGSDVTASILSKSCTLHVLGGDLRACQSGSCLSASCDQSAWKTGLDTFDAHARERLMPLSFTLKPVFEVLKRSQWFEVEASVGFRNALEEAIKRKVEEIWKESATVAEEVVVPHVGPCADPVSSARQVLPALPVVAWAVWLAQAPGP